jgi:glutamate:Na+ symporter, ESS family
MNSLLLVFVVLGFFNTISNLPFFKKYRIQGSLIAGIVGLVFFTLFPDYKNSSEYSTWKDWPGITIAMVFSALFLEIRSKSEEKGKFAELYTQTSYVYIAIIGQMLIGVVSTLLLFKPIFKLPMAFSSILENGFAGGHGTAVAMKQAYIDNGLPNGSEYALFSATVGILFGIVGGITLVELTKIDKPIPNEVHIEPLTSFDLPKLFINLGIICGSVYLGYLLKNQIKESNPTLPEFPLFVYALLVSVVVRNFLVFFGKKDFIDNSIISFLSNFFMEILIFTAIATMNLSVISEALLPMIILFILGFLWNLFCYFFLTKKLLEEDIALELSILNFGMLNGTTAIGLMLLKMIDPELKSRAIKIFAESAPLTSPIVGGGVLTLSLPYLLESVGSYTMAFLLLGVILSIYASAILIQTKSKQHIG